MLASSPQSSYSFKWPLLINIAATFRLDVRCKALCPLLTFFPTCLRTGSRTARWFLLSWCFPLTKLMHAVRLSPQLLLLLKNSRVQLWHLQQTFSPHPFFTSSQFGRKCSCDPDESHRTFGPLRCHSLTAALAKRRQKLWDSPIQTIIQVLVSPSLRQSFQLL